MPLSPALTELAHAYDVVTEYHDWRGQPVEVSEETVVSVLRAMGVDVSDPGGALAAHEEEPWRRTLPACVVAVAGQAATVRVHAPAGSVPTVHLDLEEGGRRDLAPVITADHTAPATRTVGGTALQRTDYEVPTDLPLGYHTLTATIGLEEATTAPLIVTPARLELPLVLRERRGWGFAAQLYSVRSAQSWGVGDLADMTDLGVWSAGLGADYLLVNPLHAAEPAAPLEPSPYLPTSRRFPSPLYLRVERIPEYADLHSQARAAAQALAAETHAELNSLDFIDRDASWTAKREALRLVHGVPLTPGRALSYAAFRDREGDALSSFATWRALALEHGPDFRTWPEELRDATSPAVAAAADGPLSGEIDFECWMQWVLDEQLRTVQAESIGAGMALGTMHDLAVGVHPGGADAWRMRETYAEGVRVGAPPDAFNQLGQDWSQPPWTPHGLAESGYAPFREMVAALLRHAGGVRIDHVIGLFRLWWVPEGQTPDVGTYVRYDHEAIIGVLALEAHRAGAVVVGEDLGVVEPSARAYLLERGILGTSILWFERDGNGNPLPAQQWRELCLASVTTHDLPPTAGYLDGVHVGLRESLGLLTRPVEEERAADEAERASWMAEIRDQTDLPRDADIEATVLAAHAYLALTPSRLRCVALTDAVGDRRTQNQPGTSNEYPNWRIPLSGPDEQPLALEAVLSSQRARTVARVVDQP